MVVPGGPEKTKIRLDLKSTIVVTHLLSRRLTPDLHRALHTRTTRNLPRLIARPVLAGGQTNLQARRLRGGRGCHVAVHGRY